MKKDVKRSFYRGKKITVEVFGGSHDDKIGVNIWKMQGEKFDPAKLQEFLDRRKPKGDAYSTPRKEGDEFKIIRGFRDGVMGEHFSAVIYNTNQHSKDYSGDKIPRPSHADFVAWEKYGDNFDHRGGGKFSGRLTAPMCIAGGIIKQILEEKGIKINAYISKIGLVKGKTYTDVDVEKFDFKLLDKDFPTLDKVDKERMLEETSKARAEGDSIGGVIDCVVTGLPLGVGEHMFDSVEGVISKLIFSVPAVKGIEFGSGFLLAEMRGSKANDCYYYEGDKVKTKTNNNGGILGGITSGMPLTFRVVIKPTPSISKEQDSVNLTTKENTKLKILGRHDACIVPRAVPVIEGICAMALYDIMDF